MVRAGPAGNGIFHLVFGILLMFSLLAGCGGGGGGGGNGGGPVVRRLGAEYHAQPGLAQVGAGQAFLSGWEGSGVRAGIADSGIDGSHIEFKGRLTGGGDWQGIGSGLSDPDGHGSHVAGILGAGQNNGGMIGVAPSAGLTSYRILNDYGFFGSRTGEQMIPGLVSAALSGRVQLLNNSWASNYEIDDLAKSRISALMPDELAAWQRAVSGGMVMVWAAGNDGENNVSVRAGLPYYFSALERGWLAVAAVGPDGRETRYTNRCGLSADWCLTAPGGGYFWPGWNLFGQVRRRLYAQIRHLHGGPACGRRAGAGDGGLSGPQRPAGRGQIAGHRPLSGVGHH